MAGATMMCLVACGVACVEVGQVVWRGWGSGDGWRLVGWPVSRWDWWGMPVSTWRWGPFCRCSGVGAGGSVVVVSMWWWRDEVEVVVVAGSVRSGGVAAISRLRRSRYAHGSGRSCPVGMSKKMGRERVEEYEGRVEEWKGGVEERERRGGGKGGKVGYRIVSNIEHAHGQVVPFPTTN
ncbi:hypothetical protein EDB89DRAFT_1909534 [Lactarius sanguifluus]|nr:hypothetical protein EDB89DRAFT_1909534 [Lactarius sanguifluus]